MKQSPDNQINASFIDISRIKRLVFFIAVTFLPHNYVVLLASSEATAYYRPAPGRTDGIPERHWRQCLLSRATEPCPLGLRETLACIHVILHMSRPRVACWHGSRQNSQKTECVLRHPPIGGWKENCELVKSMTNITRWALVKDALPVHFYSFTCSYWAFVFYNF